MAEVRIAEVFVIAGKIECGFKRGLLEFYDRGDHAGNRRIAKADDDMKVKIKRELYVLMDDQFPGGHIALDSASLVVYGEK